MASEFEQSKNKEEMHNKTVDVTGEVTQPQPIDSEDSDKEADPKENATAGKKAAKRKKLILNVLLVICAAVIVYCGVRIYGIYSEYGKGDKVNESMGQFVQVNETVDGKGQAISNINVDFEALLGVNKDVVGWIYLQDSPIDYAVVQGKDNSYYLDHAVTGEVQSYGAIFVDAYNSPGFADDNTVIYGHRMNNGAMFAELLKYEKQSFYDGHKTMILATPEGNYTLEVFSARKIAAEEENYPLTFGDADSFMAFINEAKNQSLVQAEVEVSAGDRLIMLSTCIKGDDSRRFVVHAKLVPIDAAQ